MFALLARISCYLTNRVTCENLLEFDSLTIGSLLLFTTFPILNISLTWLQIAYQTKYLRSTGSSSLTVRIRRFLLVYYGVVGLVVLFLFGFQLSYYAFFVLAPSIFFIIFVFLSGYFKLRQFVKVKDGKLLKVHREMKKSSIVVVTSIGVMFISSSILLFTPLTIRNPFFNLNLLFMFLLIGSCGFSNLAMIWYCWKQVTKHLKQGSSAVMSKDTSNRDINQSKEILVVDAEDISGDSISNVKSLEEKFYKTRQCFGIVICKDDSLFQNADCLIQLYAALYYQVPIALVQIGMEGSTRGNFSTYTPSLANMQQLASTVKKIDDKVCRQLKIDRQNVGSRLNEFFSKQHKLTLLLDQDLLKQKTVIDRIFAGQKRSCWSIFKSNPKGGIGTLFFFVIICSLAYVIVGLLTPPTKPSPFSLLQQSIAPSFLPTQSPTNSPSLTFHVTHIPSHLPTKLPTRLPTLVPTNSPTQSPTSSPTNLPTKAPSSSPTEQPTSLPTLSPTKLPSKGPSVSPTKLPTHQPTNLPTLSPTKLPSNSPTKQPTFLPTLSPTKLPSKGPSVSPTKPPTHQPTNLPTFLPTKLPTKAPSSSPTKQPTQHPTKQPTTASPSSSPTKIPTNHPTTRAPSASPTTSTPSVSPSHSPTPVPTLGFQQIGKLVGTGYSRKKSGIFQGSAVAMSADGTTGVVGGFGDDDYTGAIWIFDFNSTSNEFTQSGTKLVGTGAVGGRSSQGISVAMSRDGSNVLSGGSFDNNLVGATWLFLRNSTTGMYSQVGSKFVGTGYVGQPRQGCSTAIDWDANTFVIGGFNDSDGRGAAWVYTLNSTGSWNQLGSKLVPYDSSTGSHVGSSVAIAYDGSIIVLAGNTDSGNIGAVWVFFKNTATGFYYQFQSKLVGTGSVPSPTNGVQQGTGLAINLSGTTILVGGPYDNNSTGAAWIFQYNSSKLFSQVGTKFTGAGAVGKAMYGYSCALRIDETLMFVGGPQDNNGVGALWPYEQNSTTKKYFQLGPKLVGTGAVGNALQGSALGTESAANLIFSGGYDDSTETGATWVYQLV